MTQYNYYGFIYAFFPEKSQSFKASKAKESRDVS